MRLAHQMSDLFRRLSLVEQLDASFADFLHDFLEGSFLSDEELICLASQEV